MTKALIGDSTLEGRRGRSSLTHLTAGLGTRVRSTRAGSQKQSKCKLPTPFDRSSVWNTVGGHCLFVACQAPSSRRLQLSRRDDACGEQKTWRTTAQSHVMKCPRMQVCRNSQRRAPGWVGVWPQWHLPFRPSHSIPSSGSGSNIRLVSHVSANSLEKSLPCS